MNNSLKLTSNYLNVTETLCSQCKKSLPVSGEYVKCLSCGSKCHFSPCSTLSATTYASMSTDKKKEFKCHLCRKDGNADGRKSPNTLYKYVIYDGSQDQQSNKQQRQDDEETNETGTKKFKDALSLTSVNNNVCSLQKAVSDLKTEMKGGIEQLTTTITTTITASNNILREEMSNALTKLAESMANLATQVNELKAKSKEKDVRIQNMENKVNALEQQLINKSIEIKNVENKDFSASDVIKRIATSVNVDVHETDISNSYRIKQKDDKIIVEFSSLNKKRELMSKIRSHRISGDVLNTQTSNEDNNNVSPAITNNIFINDQLTAHNRKLLWLAKTKAKDCGWKFVWVRNGHLFAKKTETSTKILLLNASDLELIC